MTDFATLFGITMGQLVDQYRASYAWLAPLPHLVTLVLLVLILRGGQRHRRVLALFFAIDYAWMLVFVGGRFSVQLYRRLGLPGLAMYAATPVLLALILYQWIQEIRHPRLDLDLARFEKWRLIVAVPILLWGFWYPPYEWGVRLVFDPRELVFGAYGLMGCPTTMVALAILFLKYPQGNRPLFQALTVYAVCIGAAMVALRYVPDIPFFLIGLASLGLIVACGIRERRQKASRLSPGPSV